MTSGVLRDIFSFLEENRPYYGEPWLVILGGSQTLDNGIHKTKDSDFDILALFPHIDMPESYTFTSAEGRTYDLILRDPASLAYDIHQALNEGKGTLIHIAAYGQTLYNPQNIGTTFQSYMKSIHEHGPKIIHIKDVQNELTSLRSNLSHTDPDHPSYTACLTTMTNRIARLALHFNGHWTSNGKIAGRFLKQNIPDFCNKIRNAFTEAASTRSKHPVYDLIDRDLPAFFYGLDPLSRIGVAPQHQHYAYQKSPDCIGEAITAARCNMDALGHYLQRGSYLSASAAATWANIRTGNVIKPLTEDRFQKKPEEYFFALGRAIGAVADTESALTLYRPSSKCATQRIIHLFDRHPHLGKDFQDALTGAPEGLQQFTTIQIAHLPCEPFPYLHRPSPSHMKLGAATLYKAIGM